MQQQSCKLYAQRVWYPLSRPALAVPRSWKKLNALRLGSSLAIGSLSLFNEAQMQHALKLIPTLFAATPSRVAKRPRGDSSETGRSRRDDTASQKGGSCAPTVQKGSHTSGQVTKEGDSTLTNGHAGTRRTAPCGSATFPEVELGSCRSRATSQRLANHPSWASGSQPTEQPKPPSPKMHELLRAKMAYAPTSGRQATMSASQGATPGRGENTTPI